MIVFLGGAEQMSLEMVGSRVLAPYFGTSIFVWGSLIGVFLAALSVGNFVGGRLADRRPEPAVLAGYLAAAAILVLSVPFAAAPVNSWLDARFADPRLGSLLSTLTLFAVPSVLLGMVSPYAIRLEARSVTGMGNTAGMLYALSTAGSILGTFATAFVLIPAMGVRNILYFLGASVLLLSALGYLAGARRSRALVLALVAVPFLASSLLWSGIGVPSPRHTGTGLAAESILLEKDTLYHHMVVAETNGIRYLGFDDSIQGGMYVDDPGKTPVEYVPRMTLGLVLQPKPERALLVGLGPAALPKLLLSAYPNLRLDVVEIDPDVVKVAKDYFYLPAVSNLKVHTVDGRDFLKSTRTAYDLVFLDAYYASSIPFHLTTREFLDEVKAKLAPGGVVVANVIGAVTGDQSRLFRAMYRTFRSVFPGVYVFLDQPNSYATQNLILVASREARGTKAFSADLLPAALANDVGWVTKTDLLRYAGGLYTDTVKIDDVPLLTDDYAPLDSLLNVYKGKLIR